MLGDKEEYLKLYLLMNNRMMEHLTSNLRPRICFYAHIIHRCAYKWSRWNYSTEL